jgi:hypothetical protein
MSRPVPAEDLGGEPGNVVDVPAEVPLVARSDRLDCLGKYHHGACGPGEFLETGQACLAIRGRAGAMKAHDDRRDRRARRGPGHEVGTIGAACRDDLLLKSHGASIADGGLPGVAGTSEISRSDDVRRGRGRPGLPLTRRLGRTRQWSRGTR